MGLARHIGAKAGAVDWCDETTERVRRLLGMRASNFSQ